MPNVQKEVVEKMAVKRHAKKTKILGKTGKTGKTTSFASFLRKEEREVARKMHGFLHAWKQHIKDEIEVHKRLASGKSNLKKHVKETLKVHEKFLKKINSL